MEESDLSKELTQSQGLKRKLLGNDPSNRTKDAALAPESETPDLVNDLGYTSPTLDTAVDRGQQVLGMAATSVNEYSLQRTRIRTSTLTSLAAEPKSHKISRAVENAMKKLYEEEQEKNRLLSTHLSWIMKRMDSETPLTRLESQRMKSIGRTLQTKSEGSAKILLRLTEDLVKADKDAARNRDRARELGGSTSFIEKSDALQVQPQQTIHQQWMNVPDILKMTTGIEYKGQLPPRKLVGSLAGQIDDLLLGSGTADALVNWYSNRVAPSVENHCMLQPLIAALVSHYVFSDSSLMFNGEHSRILKKIYSVIDLQIMSSSVSVCLVNRLPLPRRSNGCAEFGSAGNEDAYPR
jgi:hypothetical protein